VAISIQEAERRLNAGEDISAITGSQWEQLKAIETANNNVGRGPQPQASAEPGPGFLGGAPAATAADEEKVDPNAYAKLMRIKDEKTRVQNVVATLTGVMNDYGLGSLLAKVTQMVQEGLNSEAVMAQVRQTTEYADRFPAMKTLAGKQRVLSEAEYIAFERNASSLERSYGLPEGMLGKDKVTKLLENEVSAKELGERVNMAAVGAFQTSVEVKDQFRDYYGISSGGLTAYFLDPDQALPLLERQYTASQIGAEAQIQDFNFDVKQSERLTQYGLTRESARQGITNAADQKAFQGGFGDTVTQDQLIDASLMGDSAAQKSIERVKKGRQGRFDAGGGYASNTKGVTGLGSANKI
jgi:hypothetical protein